jgi:23S rRNA (guanosine2251-2'-O)-methyltransferase
MDNSLMIFGIRPVLEALEAGKPLEKVMVSNGLEGVLFHQLRKALEGEGIPLRYVPVQKLNTLTKSNHQGVIGYMSSVTYVDLEDMINRDLSSGKTPVYALLDGITDVRNFGAICRSAECFGLSGVIIPQSGSASVNADAIKASAGALHRMPVSRVNNLIDAAHLLHQSGFRLIAVTEKGQSMGDSSHNPGPKALILGSEERGISKMLLKLSDESWRIPMAGTIASLNVSVAAAIAFRQIAKQEGFVEN